MRPAFYRITRTPARMRASSVKVKLRNKKTNENAAIIEEIKKLEAA